jgi:hypothetical protein
MDANKKREATIALSPRIIFPKFKDVLTDIGPNEMERKLMKGS